MHSWSPFGPRTSHGHTRTHKIHHGPDLGEATTFPLILFSVINHMGYIQMSFFPKTPNLGVPKFSKLGFLAFWTPITFCEDLRLKLSLNKSFSIRQEIFNDMLHTTCMHVFQGDSRLLEGGSQIDSLTPDPSFGHNLCYKYSNASCKLILDI
jgi:hypothetical protein